MKWVILSVLGAGLLFGAYFLFRKSSATSTSTTTTSTTGASTGIVSSLLSNPALALLF